MDITSAKAMDITTSANNADISIAPHGTGTIYSSLSTTMDGTAGGAGAGVSGMANYKVYITKEGGETITKLYIDIEGLKHFSPGNSVIGDYSGSGQDNAYLYKVTTAVNGFIYKVEMFCVEATASDPSGTVGSALNLGLASSTISRVCCLSNKYFCFRRRLFNKYK